MAKIINQYHVEGRPSHHAEAISEWLNQRAALGWRLVAIENGLYVFECPFEIRMSFKTSVSVDAGELSRLRGIEAAARKFDEAGSLFNQMSSDQWLALNELKGCFHGGVKESTRDVW